MKMKVEMKKDEKNAIPGSQQKSDHHFTSRPKHKTQRKTLSSWRSLWKRMGVVQSTLLHVLRPVDAALDVLQGLLFKNDPKTSLFLVPFLSLASAFSNPSFRPQTPDADRTAFATHRADKYLTGNFGPVKNEVRPLSLLNSLSLSLELSLSLSLDLSLSLELPTRRERWARRITETQTVCRPHALCARRAAK